MKLPERSEGKVFGRFSGKCRRGLHKLPFSDYTLPICFQRIKTRMNYLIIPLIGAFIGYITNYVAVKMLFHPRREIRILFLPIQGVFPKRQRVFAQKLGEVVSTELISVEEIVRKLADKAGSEKIMLAVGEHIERVITEKLPKVIPMLAMVLSPELVTTVKGAFVTELKGMIEQVVQTIGSDLTEEVDIRQIVEEKVLNFSPDKLEEILFAIMRREFRFIELIGGVLGFLIGMIQVALLDVVRF